MPQGKLLTAAQMPAQDPSAALPAVVLAQTNVGPMASSLPPARTTVNAGLLAEIPKQQPLVWTARRDLLASGPTDLNFVPEAEDDDQTYLRFGDDEHGRAVRLGDTFQAYYRVGNGPDGNVGGGRINRLVLPPGMDKWSGAGLTIRNPLPASGGTAPQSLEEVKRLAPEAFHTDLRRAVVADDYAKVVTAHYPEVRRAAATRRWTGAGDLIVVAVDFLAAVPQTRRDDLRQNQIPTYFKAFRRIGHAVSVREAAFAALDVALNVYLLPTALRSPTIARLQQLFGTAPLPDGKPGFFDPDNFSFGEGLAKSRLVALAQGVPGVEHVEVTRLRRVGATGGPDAPPFLAVGPLEVVRLDNDPNRAENGRLTLNPIGGR
jgi:predicted phage baseplate assembly protein